MKKEIYITFNKKDVTSMRSTKPDEDVDYVKINMIVDDSYFTKPKLEATIHITDDKLQEYKLELKRLKEDK